MINNQIHCLLHLIQRAVSALYDFGKVGKALSKNTSGRIPVVEQIHKWEIRFLCDTPLAWVLICIWGKRNQDIYSREQKRRGYTIRKSSYCLCLPAVELVLIYTNVHRRRISVTELGNRLVCGRRRSYYLKTSRQYGNLGLQLDILLQMKRGCTISQSPNQHSLLGYAYSTWLASNYNWTPNCQCPVPQSSHFRTGKPSECLDQKKGNSTVWDLPFLMQLEQLSIILKTRLRGGN